MTPHDSDELSASTPLDGYEWSQLRFALLAAGALVLGPLTVLGFRLVNGYPPRLQGILQYALVGAVVWVLGRRGHRRASFLLLTFGLWACSMYAFVLASGQSFSPFTITVVVLAFAAWFAGQGPALVLTFMTPPFLYAFGYLDSHGWPDWLGQYRHGAYEDATVRSIIALGSGALGYLSAASLRQHLLKLHETTGRLHGLVEEGQRREQQLQRLERRFEKLFRFGPNASLITGSEGGIVDCNLQFEQLTGYDRTQLIGRSTRSLGLWKNPQDRQRLVETLQRDGQVSAFEAPVRRADGLDGTVLIYATPLELDGQQYTLFHVMDITERKRSEERIRELALIDQLSGLPNRALLMDRMQQARAAQTRSGMVGALVMLDLDNFKAQNDSYGLELGDRLLKAVGERLARNMREGDTVARFGGDEFVLLLPALNEARSDAALAAEAIIQKLQAALLPGFELDGVVHHASACFGIVLFSGAQVSSDDLLKQADMAMFKAKSAGRSQFRHFDPAVESALRERAVLEQDLRRAMAEGQLQLYYQAQLDGGGQLVAVEALARWPHPVRGMVAPDQFIPLAEESGLMSELGCWVLETACRQLVNWATHPAFQHLTISVNVSAGQFYRSDFVTQIVQILQRTGALPRRLKLELTESTLITNVDDVVRTMVALRNLGIGFSLDDFGTGYSSLAYLNQLPLDQLKIDKTFVQGIENSEICAVICATTISMAHGMRMKVVAEGVETQAQRYFLNTVHHCDLLQGHLYSKALPAAQFEARYGQAQ